MSRFERDCKLTITVDGRTVTIQPPLRISFDCMKSIDGGLNKSTIQVFGLNERNRLAIVKDPEQRKRIVVNLAVGYQGSTETIFKGNVERGSNRREGADIVTELYCLDGGFDYLNSFTSRAVKADRIGVLLQDLPNTGRGKIGSVKDLIRPRVLVGSTMKLIDDVIDDDQTWFIDNEQLYILRDNEVISSFIPVVSAQSGLISTPERDQSIITFETLMNPSLKIGGLCNLKSKTAPHLDGVYKLTNVNYAGDNYGVTWQQTCSGILQPNYTVI